MRRVVGWIAAVVVLAGTAVGVLALVETSMASAAPSGACLRAEEQVQAQEAYLWLLSAVERTDVFFDHSALPYIRAAIAQATLVLARDEQLATQLCQLSTSTSFTSETATSFTSETATSFTSETATSFTSETATSFTSETATSFTKTRTSTTTSTSS